MPLDARMQQGKPYRPLWLAFLASVAHAPLQDRGCSIELAKAHQEL